VGPPTCTCDARCTERSLMEMRRAISPEVSRSAEGTREFPFPSRTNLWRRTVHATARRTGPRPRRVVRSPARQPRASADGRHGVAQRGYGRSVFEPLPLNETNVRSLLTSGAERTTLDFSSHATSPIGRRTSRSSRTLRPSRSTGATSSSAPTIVDSRPVTSRSSRLIYSTRRGFVQRSSSTS
jgi:hypothetical protein